MNYINENISELLLGPNRCYPLALGLALCLSLPIVTIFWGGWRVEFFFLFFFASHGFPWTFWLFISTFFFSKSRKLQKWTQELSELKQKRRQTPIKAKKPNTSLARKLICISPPHPLALKAFWVWASSAVVFSQQVDKSMMTTNR